jgi:hypothetical protein
MIYAKSHLENMFTPSESSLLLFYYNALHKHLQNDVLYEQTKPCLLQSFGL